MDDKSLLELCLGVSGKFESAAGPSYTDVAGNFDGQGLSCGVLQWNAGQGTLQALVRAIGAAMGWDKAKTFFSSDIQAFSALPAGDPAVAWCLAHYIETGTKNVDPVAKAKWQAFLGQPESVAAQVQIAASGVLGHAKREVAAYCPDYLDRDRPYAFFFDLVTQEGGMSVGHQTVAPVPSGTTPDITDALAFADASDGSCSAIWRTNSYEDPLAQLLLHYAYQRSLLANPQFRWDTCSRRGTIACRGGIVHQGKIDLTAVLD